MATVELRALRKIYANDVCAVDDIDLAIEDGEFVCLLGPSGCGKSTTLRMIAGLEQITGGELLIDGRKVNDLPSRERDIAMAFENYALYPHMTVAENIAFPLRVRKMDEKTVRDKVIEVAELMGIREILGEGVKDLSGGAQQRTGVARALVRNPQVLLLDEPISHLEEELKSRMREDLRKLQRIIGVTTIYVTHDQIEAMVMADRIAIMDLGVLQQFGKASDVYEHPENIFVGGFIGEPPMNFLECSLSADDLSFEGQSLHAPEELLSVLKKAGTASVVTGVRDTQIAVLSSKEPGSVPGTVVFVEPRNEEQILTIEFGSQSILVSTGIALKVAVNSAVWMRFDFKRINFFDKQTGRNLLARNETWRG